MPFSLFAKLILVGFIFTVGCRTTSYINSDIIEPIPTIAFKQDIDQEVAYKPTRSSNTRYFDLLHTKLEIEVDWAEQNIKGLATLHLTPYFYPQKTLVLDAKNMEINKVALITSNGEFNLQYDYDGQQLMILLDKEYQRNQQLQVTIGYITLSQTKRAAIAGATRDNQGLYFIDPLATDSLKPTQLWTQGEPEANSNWFPTIDAPNERCTQEMFITVEDRFKTLSNGTLKSQIINQNGKRTDHWSLDKPHAPYLFMMAIGEFAVIEDSFKDLPLQYWVEPEFAPYAQKIFGNTPEMIDFFSKLFNYPFPWPKYSQIVVRDFVSGAMENTTASVFMEDVQVDSRTLYDYNWDYIIAHELVHQWFGNLVTCESWSHLPLNEGFADYGEYLWNSYKYGQDEADFQFMSDLEVYLEESREKQVPLIRTNYDNPDDMFDAHSYQKAAQVLHMLRGYVGDEAFFESIHQYLTANAWQPVEVENLRLSIEEVTGEDLTWFFDQWFYAAGHPVLGISHAFENDTLYVNISQQQDLTKSTIFQLPMFVEIHLDSAKMLYPLSIQNAEEEYRIPLKSKPQLVLINGHAHILAEIVHEKSVDEYIFQYYNSTRFATRYEALLKLEFKSPNEQISKLMFDALSDPYYRIREFAIDYFSIHMANASVQVTDKIIIALQDSTSAVRVAALTFLAESNYVQYKELIAAALADSAYSVVGNALAIILEYDRPQFDNIADRYHTDTDINIVLPLAASKMELPNQVDWFLTKAAKMRTSDLYIFLPYFNAYLASASLDEKSKSVNFLFYHAQNHENNMIRFYAIQGLILISDAPGVTELVERLKQTEQDKEMLQLLNGLEVEP